jgi:hypothetical protein
MDALKAIARRWACRGGRAQTSAAAQNGTLTQPPLGSAASPPNPAALVDRLMAALDLDLHDIPNQIYRDLGIICSTCNDKARCASDLATGCSSRTYQAYCPSAHTLGTLRALQRSFKRVSTI